jgi:hypothetical protein
MSEENQKIDKDDIDAVLAYNLILSDPNFVFGEWRTAEGQFPHYYFSPKANEFLEALNKLIVVFDWPEWTDEAEALMENPDALANADLLTLRKLITTHVRAERFNEGHLAGQFENGHLLVILQRLKEIQEQN